MKVVPNDDREFHFYVSQTEHTATGVVQFPCSGRIEKRLFRNTVYCSAVRKAHDWIRERIKTHKEASQQFGKGEE